MNICKYIFPAFLAAAALVPQNVCAEWNDSIRWKAEMRVNAGGGDNSPFWIMSDQYGMSSRKPNNGYLRFGAFHDMDESKRFSWGAGADIAVGYGMQSVFFPQQLYGEVKYRCLDAMIGAKEMTDGFLNTELSSGGLTYSNNAHPIPQIRVGIFDYANVWGCKDLFAIKGYIAYGAMTDNWWIKRWANPKYDYTLNTLYCSRAIYFRIGNKEKFPLEGEIGLEMATEFGGTTYFPGGKKDKHPSDFKAWMKALVPSKGSKQTALGEQLNVEGNMLGNWAFSLRWEDPSGWMVRAYYEHFFEDHSMLFFDYTWKDGLYGIEARLPKNPFVSNVLYEFLYMKDQSGPVYWDHTPSIDYQVSERDEYYNHYIYNGWQHWGMGIGNPLLMSPIYNRNHYMYFYSTRVAAHNFGIMGQPTDQIGYKLRLSYISSLGTYTEPYLCEKHDFSMLAEVKYNPRRLHGWEGSLGFAFDKGSLMGDNYGAVLTISKTGFFK